MHERPSPLAKYTFLSSLRDQNIVLFYSLCLRYLDSVLSIIYTPTERTLRVMYRFPARPDLPDVQVGEAIQKYSTIWRRPDGLFLSIAHQNKLREMMMQAKRPKDVSERMAGRARAESSRFHQLTLSLPLLFSRFLLLSHAPSSNAWTLRLVICSRLLRASRRSI